MQCGVAELENLKMILTHECYDEFLFCCDLTEKYEEERLTQAIALAWEEFRLNDVKGLKEQKTALNYTPTVGSAADMRARLVANEALLNSKNIVETRELQTLEGKITVQYMKIRSFTMSMSMI